MDTYPIFNKQNKSLLAKYLTKEVFEKLKDIKTKNNFTLYNAIQSGIKNSDSNIGVYAGDLESYDKFGLLFNPIIKLYHNFSKTNTHSSDLDSTKLKINPLDNSYIISTRIRVGRNLKNFPLGAIINKEQRNEVEQLVSNTLLNFKDELAGNYYPLYKMDNTTKNRLIQDHFLFKNGDRFLEVADLNRDWPYGRGVFHNKSKTFLVWINEEDQLRIISMQKGGNIKMVFNRLVKAIKKIEKELPFLYHNRLGYISSCPTNLGTAMQASVHIKLPKLSTNEKLLKEITDTHHLQIRGVHGEHSTEKSTILDISNKHRLGVTEIQCVQDLYNGVTKLIEIEKSI